MKTAAQPTLFDREQPASIECHGSELAAVCADLKARGCVVHGMTVICPGSYRLALYWPPSPPFRVL